MWSRRIFGFVLFSLFCLPIAADDAADQKPFLGTWQAKFRGKVYFTIRLEGGEEIQGTVSTGKISFDDDGDLTEAEPSPTGKLSPIRNAVIENNKLTFEVEDGAETEQVGHEAEITQVVIGIADQFDQQDSKQGYRGKSTGKRQRVSDHDVREEEHKAHHDA